MRFIDYGNSEFVDSHMLKKISKELSSQPPVVFQIKLAYIKVPVYDEDCWWEAE